MNDYTVGEMRERLNNSLLDNYLDNSGHEWDEPEEKFPSHCREFTLGQRCICEYCPKCIFED